MGLAVPASEGLGEAQGSSESSEAVGDDGRGGVLLIQEGLFLQGGGTSPVPCRAGELARVAWAHSRYLICACGMALF